MNNTFQDQTGYSPPDFIPSRSQTRFDHQVSMFGHPIFYRIAPCPKCSGDAWRCDQAYLRQKLGFGCRHSCVSCGFDYYVD